MDANSVSNDGANVNVQLPELLQSFTVSFSSFFSRPAHNFTLTATVSDGHS